jgi:rubrerythrin
MSFIEKRNLSVPFRITKHQRNRFDYLGRKGVEYFRWECEQCGYLVSNAEMRSFFLDSGCPRCNYSFHQFRAVAA